MMSSAKLFNWIRQHARVIFAICLSLVVVIWLNILAGRKIDKLKLERELETAIQSEKLTIVHNSGMLAPSLATLQARRQFIEALRSASIVQSGDRIPAGVLGGYMKIKTANWLLRIEIYPSPIGENIYMIFDGSGDLKGRLRTVIPKVEYSRIVKAQ